jgi:hypothetical protein
LAAPACQALPNVLGAFFAFSEEGSNVNSWLTEKPAVAGHVVGLVAIKDGRGLSKGWSQQQQRKEPRRSSL